MVVPGNRVRFRVLEVYLLLQQEEAAEMPRQAEVLRIHPHSLVNELDESGQ